MSAVKIFTPKLSAISWASLSTRTSNARITAYLKVQKMYMYNERCSFSGLVFKGSWFDSYIFVNLGMKHLLGMLFIWVLVSFFLKIRNYESDLTLILNCTSNIFDNQNSMHINYIEWRFIYNAWKIIDHVKETHHHISLQDRKVFN